MSDSENHDRAACVLVPGAGSSAWSGTGSRPRLRIG